MKFREAYEKYTNIIINEGIVDDMKKKYLDTELIHGDDFDKLVSADPTGAKKYLAWAMAVWSKERQKIGGVENIKHDLELFDKLVNTNIITGEAKRIQSYKTYEQLHDKLQQEKDAVEAMEKKKQLKSSRSVSGFVNFVPHDKSDVIHDSKHCMIVQVKSPEAARFYRDQMKRPFINSDGKEVIYPGWCISAGEYKDYSRYFTGYSCDQKDHAQFYFLMMKSDELIKKISELPGMKYKDNPNVFEGISVSVVFDPKNTNSGNQFGFLKGSKYQQIQTKYNSHSGDLTMKQLEEICNIDIL